MADPWSSQIDRLTNVAQETKENDATKKSDDPWQFQVDRRLQAKKNRLQNEVHNASQQNAQDANDLTKLSKQTGLSPDIVASNKQEIQQTVKAQDIAQKVDNMQEPERDYLVQNQRIAPLQDDLDKVENLTRVTREKKWYDQNYFERNFLNPILSGARSAQQGFNVNQLRDSIDQVNTLNFLIGQDQNLDRSELLKIAQDNGVNVGLVGEFAGRDRAELDERLRIEREAVQSSVADLIEATKAKKDLPLDPNIDTRGGFWETLSRTITENPGAAWRLTAESIIQQTPALAAGLFTRGLGSTATGANVFGGSFLTEEPAQVIELLQEEGHDLTNPDTIIEVFTDHALMEEVQDKARRKAVATATVETMFMGLATLPIAPKSIGGVQLTNAQRELADKTINVPIQAFGEGAGEAAGQLARDGEIDFGEVALETLAGGVTGPVEVFVYGAGEYRRSRRDRQYLESMRDAIAETDGTNIDDADIRELVSRAKENGPIQEMYVDVGEFDQLLQSQNIDPDEFLESSPLIAEQYYEAQITGGDVIFQLEDFASLIAKTDLADGFIDISRTDQAGFSPSEANAWLENEAKPAVEEALAFDPATEGVPVDQIQNDITGQLIDLGYAQTAAETTAEFTATMFSRIAHITGQDPVQLYQQYGLQFIREQTEAQREVRQVTGLDNLIDRIRAGEVPTQQQQFGQSLVQFLREQGGVADDAGELAAIDPDAERPTFDRALIQDAGIPLDTARERAVEAGFLPEDADINDLLDAIDRETRGEAVFSEQFLQPEQVQLARDATLLEEELARQGLDVQQMTNEEIIQALDELIADQQPSEALQQQREESVPERSNRVLTSRDINGFDTKSNGNGIVFQETGVLEVPEADIGDLTPEQEAALELIDLGHVAWVDTDANDLVTYDIYSDGVLAGETTVQRNRETGDIVALHDIKIEQKGRGVGERAVSALLASVDDELFIVEAISSAQPFWSAMGASGFFDPNNNVRISWDGYTENKRRGRGGAFWTRALQEGDVREQDAQDGDAAGQTGVSRSEGPIEGDEPTATGVVDLSDLNEQDLELEENWFESLQPDALAQPLTDRIDELRQPVEPPSLDQERRRGTGTRGAFFFDALDRAVIQLGDAADLTTVPHEVYHLSLDIINDQAQDSPELQQELELIRNWYAENSESLKDEAIQEAEKGGDKSAATSIKMMDDEAVKEFYQSRDLSLRSLPKEGTDRFLAIAGLEQFARAGETYLLEGNAPKVELSGVFRRMKNWFIQVYNTARRLNVNLTDEMRGFFNRLIATENEIQAARDLASYGSTLTDVEGLNWTDEEREQVARLNGQARDQAEAQLIKEQVRDMEKTQQAWWETESDKARKKIFDQINTLPEYQARAMFTMGKRPDGSLLPEGVEQIKLNKQMLIDEFGAEFLKRLPSPRNTDNKAPQYVYSNEGGVDPRVAARTYGFTSARDLVEALIDSRPINAYVDSLVNLEMRNNFPDINLSGEVQELAKQAVYNDKQAQLMLAELKKLEQVAGTNPVIPQLFRQKAEQMVAMKSSRELRPDLFARTAAKFGREALRASIEGNFQDALVAKQKQLINHHMYKAAVKARDSAESVFKRAKRLQGTKTQERIGKAGGEYLERINEILTKYEFRRVTLKELDRRSSLRDWMDKKRENGEHVDIPEEVIERARRTNWREVPIEELEAVNDALKNLEHISRVKNKLLASKEERELQEVVDSVVERLEQTQSKKKGKAFFEQKRLVEKLREAGQDYASIALNIDSIIRELDGFEDLGPIYDAIKRPIDEAARSRLPELQEEFGNKLDEIYNRHFTRQEQRQFTENNWVELPGRGFLSREEALAVALNWGNEHNREAVLTGIASGQDRITPEDARVILDSLTKQDWDFAQNIWDLLDDEMWPMVRDAQKRRTGLSPEKVEASPIQTKFGVYRGGYYPVKFDRSLGWRVTAQEAEQMAQEVRMGGFAQAQTKRGFTKARTNSAQQPVKLDLSVIHTHMDEVLTDLALGDAINDVARVVNHKDFIQEMERSGNAWVVRTLDNWLKDAAAQEVLAGDILSRWARKIRVGFTVSKLAWNIGTILLQPTGLAQSLPTVGYRNMWDAISQVSKADWQGPDNIVTQVRDRSAFMRTRGAGFNKDIQITLNALKGPGFVESILERVPWVRNLAEGTGPQKAAEFFFNSFMGGIVAVQQIVDTIVWLGAYNKVKDTMSDADAVQFADNTVARTQASAVFTDRTAFERGSLSQNTRQSEFVRLWTVLGSYMFAKANIAYEQTKKTSFRDPNQIAEWMHDMFLLFVFEAIFIGLLRNTIPDEEDEDETVLGFLGKESLNSLLSGMPIVRDGASALNGFQGGGALGGFWQEVGKLGTQVSQGELDAPLVKSLNNVGGVMFKYPSGQINRFFDTLWKDLDGEDVDTIDYLLWRKQ